MQHNSIPDKTDKVYTRLMKQITKIDNDGCWLWNGALNEKGYARCSINCKVYKVHRVMLAWDQGDQPTLEAGHVAHEICSNRNCVKPEHLCWQTHAENINQQKIDGTSEGGKRYKLNITDTQRNEIIQKYVKRQQGLQSELAKEYNLTCTQIKHIWDYARTKGLLI